MYFNRVDVKKQKEMFSHIQNRNYSFSCVSNSNNMKVLKKESNTNEIFDNLNNHLNENMNFLNNLNTDNSVSRHNQNQRLQMMKRQKQAMIMKKGCGCGKK